ncbi:hypothetical protein GGR26_003260 [Lewinella marina]|nr:hypothetical protein [Neolewinella marina]
MHQAAEKVSGDWQTFCGKFRIFSTPRFLTLTRSSAPSLRSVAFPYPLSCSVCTPRSSTPWP